MPMHRLTSIALGVSDVDAATEFYEDFGLEHLGGAKFSSVDGGEQLRLVQSDRRRLVELGVGVDDPDDLDRIGAALDAGDYPWKREGDKVLVNDGGTKLSVTIEIAPRLSQKEAWAPEMNGPAHTPRPNERADGAFRDGKVRPRRLGHVVVGTTELDETYRLFVDTLGFRISDEVGMGARFLRCSTDHHNLFVQPSPVDFLHHTSWEVDDVDEIGRGAARMLEKDPDRHVWGLGRHNVGSNFFWYLKDPAGNFAEYYSDLDVIVEDELWDPGVFLPDKHDVAAWAPPRPRGFFRPPSPEEFAHGLHQG